MIYQEQINPWTCMPLLGTIEFFKDSFDLQNINEVTTRQGFQPLMDNPITWDNFADCRTEVTNVCLKHYKNFEFARSWFVSYNLDGYQKPHSHSKYGDCDFSGVVCLLGSADTGALCFEDKKICMTQGDVVLFSNTERHWTEPTAKPKVVLAFDGSFIN